MSLGVSLDYALATADGVGPDGGLKDSELAAEAPAFDRAVRRIMKEAAAGRLGFWGLPNDPSALHAIADWEKSIDPGLTDVLLLGIGGSSLGARAMLHALGGPAEVPLTKRRLYLPDNSDPWLLAALLDRLDPKKTLAIVISKSGGTVETAAQMLVVRAWLDAALGDASKNHVAFITDPEYGPLRKTAQLEGITAFEVPQNVGGRFSVLSAVGLMPAQLMGFDTAGLLGGAARMAEACARPELKDNPAGMLAVIHALQHRLRGRDVHVLMPYSDALRPFAAWYVQLWAESLGKRLDRQGRVVESGPTPIAAVGATDQHAQMQLFMEGPRNKVVTFLSVATPARDITIPSSGGEFAYLGGRTLWEVLEAERRGTTLALASDGRPSLSLELNRLDAESLGSLFFLYEAATAFCGELYGIDAFDQPGVELSKRLASGLLGRPGFESAAEEVREAEQAQPHHRVGH